MSDKLVFPTSRHIYSGNPIEGGMTMRENYATTTSTDDIRDLSYRFLSRAAQEKLVGMKYPERSVDDGFPRPVDYSVNIQIAQAKFLCAVNAALRFMHADAMIEASKRFPSPQTHSHLDDAS